MKLKSIVMPNNETIRTAIVNSYDVDGIEEYAQLVADSIAGTSKNGYGVVLALQIQARSFVQRNNYPSMMETLIFMMIPEFLKVIVNDPQVVADGMELYNKVSSKDQS